LNIIITWYERSKDDIITGFQMKDDACSQLLL